MDERDPKVEAQWQLLFRALDFAKQYFGDAQAASQIKKHQLASINESFDQVRAIFSRGSDGGVDLDYIFPVSLMMLMVPIILGSSFIAALGPAEAAVHANLVEALEYE